jgi:hypothetical protein
MFTSFYANGRKLALLQLVQMFKIFAQNFCYSYYFYCSYIIGIYYVLVKSTAVFLFLVFSGEHYTRAVWGFRKG